MKALAPRPRSFRLARLLAIAAGTAAIAWLLSSAAVTWKLLRRPRPPFAEPIPAWAVGQIEERRIDTRDGEELGAWLLASPGSAVSVLVLHGNGGSRTSQADLVRWLSTEGATVLAPSLRAHGDSTCALNDFGWSAREDVIACVSVLEQRAPGTPIVVCAESLGAAAAIYAAGELGQRVAAYVLEAPYRDLRAATRHRLEIYLPPVLDDVAYAGLCLWARLLLSPRLDELSPLDRASEIPREVDVLLLSGTEDRHAPLADVEEIRRRLGDRARLVSFPGASHHPLRYQDPRRYEQTLREVLGFARTR